MTDDLKVILQFTWLVVSGAATIAAFLLRRSSLRLAKDTRTQRYFRSQGQAWEATAIEMMSATARGVAGFYLPASIPILILLSIGLFGRIYQVVRLWNANSAINSGVE